MSKLRKGENGMKSDPWKNSWRTCPQCDKQTTIVRELDIREGDILMKEYHLHCDECKLPFESFVPMEDGIHVK